MTLSLHCPTGNQSFFDEIGELTKRMAETRPKASPSVAVRPPQLVSSTQCSFCNKKFTTPAALFSHQKAKRHLPPRPASPRRSVNSVEHVHTPEIRAVSPPAVAVNGSAVSNKLNVAEQPAVHGCSECQAKFNSLTELKAHQSSHGQFPCSKCSYLSSSLVEWNVHFNQAHKSNPPSSRPAEPAPELILPSQGGASTAIARPPSPQPINNKGASPSRHGKGLLVCELCKKEFKVRAGLQAHMAAKHPVRAECVICHLICPSTAALEEHVDTVHSCTVCHDGILRDAQTLSDHMIEHSHPVPCKRCGTRYRTEEERGLHFAAADNDHPVCGTCRTGFEDDIAFSAHINLAHSASRRLSPTLGPRRSSSEVGVEAHAVATYPRGFQCDVCHEACSSQTELDIHVVTVHSCPICHDGIYMDMRTLEEHLEQHRSAYTCHACGLAYAEESQLFEHYKDSSNDVHPHCEKCQLGFENGDAYTIHIDEAHPRIACDVCEGELFDQDELAIHYLKSRMHPKCEKCGVGFRDRFDYTEHGASAHPECHCYLCQWHFDSPNVLENHVKHFFNHPKCQDCNTRFANADAYQHHLFTVHRPNFGDHGRSVVSVEPDREGEALREDLSTPPTSARAIDPVWGFEGSVNLPYASFIPLPPSLSGYSSPTSQLVVAESSDSSGSHSRSSTLSVEQRSPTDGQLWNGAVQSLSLVASQNPKTSPEFEHSPLPAVGTPPLISGVQTIQSADIQSPFSPRPEPPPLFSLSQGITDAAVTAEEHDEADSTSTSPITRSPPLISPVVKLPDPGAASPTSTSSWTMTSDTGSRRSSPRSASIPSSKRISATPTLSLTMPSDHAVPQLSLLVPSVNGPGNSGCPSSISPESAGISVSASMTPEYLREARAYLSLTHQTQEPSTPLVSHSPPILSPVLSSAGLALGDRGRRREVRFEENIMAEAAWDRQSTSSDSSLEPPIIPRPGASGFRTNGISKLPRFSALRRPARKWTHVPHPPHHPLYGRRQNGSALPTPAPKPTAPLPSYHCRSCYRDHCEEPTTTTCGHLFCYECISTAVMKESRCPVCEAPTLLYCLFRIDTSA